MARRKKQQVEQQEVKEEISAQEPVKEEVETEQVVEEPQEAKKEEVEEPAPPRTLDEYIKLRVAQQQAAIDNAPKTRAISTRDAKGNVQITVENIVHPPVKKGRLVRNTIVSNSYTGWQRTLLAGTEVEIVNEFNNRVTIKAYGMLHTVAAKYIEKL